MSRYVPEVGDRMSVLDYSGKEYPLVIQDMIQYRVQRANRRHYDKMIPVFGDDVLQPFLGTLRYRLDNHYDNVIAVTGEERCGKSNTAIRLAKMLDKRFTEDQVLFDVYDDINPLMRRLGKGNVVILDEAGKEINSRQWSKKEQKELVTKFQVFGKKQITVIIVMPRFSYLDSAIRDTRLKFWLQVKAFNKGADRGYVFFKEAVRDEYTNKTWWDTMYAGRIKPPTAFSEYTTIMEAYELKKDAYIDSVLTPVVDENITKPRQQRDWLIWFLLESKVMTQNELASFIGLKRDTVKQIKSDIKHDIPINKRVELGFEPLTSMVIE